MSKEIYIKIEPTIGILDKEETKKLLESAESSRYNFEALESYLRSEGKNLDNFLDDLFENNEGIIKEDWTGCNNFWTSKEAENGIIMVEQSLTGTGIKRGFKSKNNLDKEFISLSSFFEKGKYVGKFFRRTKKIYDEDIEFLPVNRNIFALYEYEGTILVVKRTDERFMFNIISKRYTRDENYEYYGVQRCGYDDVKTINKEIVKQLKK